MFNLNSTCIVDNAHFKQFISVRALYGLSDTRNAGHGSDSPESFQKEAKLMFPDLDYKDLVAES